MAILFEYGDWIKINSRDALINMLFSIWGEQLKVEDESFYNRDINQKTYQPFLNFDGSQVKANNYIGFLQTENDIIEIYPKVFRNIENAEQKKALMLKHIFYWLHYCRKWKFPFNYATLDFIDINEFPELIIYLIANQFYDIVSKQPLNLYQTIEEALYSPKGSINFNRYLNNNYTRGSHHKINCNYEPFIFDNIVNRIIKYCTRLLLGLTNYYENQRILQEIIFILDEVEDEVFLVNDAEKLKFNPFYEDYRMVLDSCKIILNQQLYSNNLYDLSQWCLLLPMEYIFEDYIAGFLEDQFNDKWDVEYQKSEKYLAVNEYGRKVFNMQHDIFLTSKSNSNKKIIIDTKYKLRDIHFKNDIKKGIAQQDLYQMVSYAYRRGCSDVVLIYPNITEEIQSADFFEIISGWNETEKITVTAFEIPFWSFNEFTMLENKLKTVLANKFEDIIKTG